MIVAADYEILSRGIGAFLGRMVTSPTPIPRFKGLQLEVPDGSDPSACARALHQAWGRVSGGKCLIAGCARPPTMWGRCESHKLAPKCAGPECARTPVVKGMCQAHYLQVRSGRALTVIRPRSTVPTVLLSVRIPAPLVAQLGPSPGPRILEILTAHLTTQKGAL